MTFRLENKTILLTGGTGSFGKKFTEMTLEKDVVSKLIIFSRDELKQFEMRQQFEDHPKLRFFLGDVRDKTRLFRAMNEVDIVIHAAALKQVPACEYNPIEAVKTNVYGAKNVIEAALDRGVDKVIALSSDKAVNPINLYGATKLVAEKLFVQANSYRGSGATKFSCVRYGNVIGSRGSVIPKFIQQRQTGTLTITDERMTRFWLTLESAVDLVLDAIYTMYGGEIFVPQIPSMRIMALAQAIAPECDIRFIGIRPGEKLHETLISLDEARHTRHQVDRFLIQPVFPWWDYTGVEGTAPMRPERAYTSDTNTEWLTQEDLKKLIEDYE